MDFWCDQAKWAWSCTNIFSLVFYISLLESFMPHLAENPMKIGRLVSDLQAELKGFAKQ